MRTHRSILVRTDRGQRRLNIPRLDLNLAATARSDRNESLLALCYVSWLQLLQDSPLVSSKSRSSWRPLRRFYNELTTDNAMTVLKRYSSLGDKLLKSLTLYGDSYSVGEWVEGFEKTPVFREYHQFYTQGDPELLRFLVSFLFFGKKLRVEDDEFYSTALNEWIAIEERLSLLVIPDDNLTASLKAIIGGLLQSFELSPLRPKFGPGKVAERGVLNVDEKFHNLFRHPIIDSLLAMSGLDKSEHDEYCRFLCLGDRKAGSKFSNFHGCFMARLKFVPKDITKARSICMEPDVLMYAQQSVLRDFVDCFRNGFVRHFVDLSDQTPNQLAALYGSYTGDVDTIDMSAASDTVSWQLIEKVFPTDLVRILALLRSEYAELPDGSVLRLQKFAPMGSALCFPIQNVIFLAFSLLAGLQKHLEGRGLGLDTAKLWEMEPSSVVALLREVHFDRMGFIHPGTRKFQPPRIFGDDICIDSAVKDTLVTMLTRYGFMVNQAKSFVGNQAVRESCGKYYYRGHDITPLRFSLGFRTSLTDARAVSSQIDFVNRVFGYGYVNLWRFHVRELICFDDGINFPIQFSSRDDLPFRIYAPKVDNSSLRRFGWSPDVCRSRHANKHGVYTDQPKGCHALDLQRSEEYCYVDVAKDPKVALQTEASDGYRYMRWWVERGDRVVEPIVVGHGHTYAAGDRIRLGWTPA